jgi:hypothetical protein
MAQFDFSGGWAGGGGSRGIVKLPPFDIRKLKHHSEEYMLMSERLESFLKDTLFWSLRLMMEVQEKYLFFKQVPGYRYTAYGFFDDEYKEIKFGIIIYAAFDYSKGDLDKNIPKSVIADDHEFPVRLRRIHENLHEFGSNPPGGTGGCYARSRVTNNSLGPGILTAKHVVGRELGTFITLSCGCKGKIIDSGPDGIDAALIQTDCSKAVNPVVPLKYIAPWMDVVFWGGSSGTIKTKITAVTDTRGILNSEVLPSRIFLANPGKPGDSGALVTTLKNDEAVGIYMGEFIDDAGQKGGIAQNVFQVTQIMDMELYL